MGHPSRRFAEKAGYQRKVRCRCGAGASAGVDGYTSAATTVHDTPARAVERTLAAITPASVAAYAEVARPAFVLKSCAMILLSAVVASRSPAAVMQPLVWAAASITACITGGSMMVNDYFDWKSGVDKINNPGRAIPSSKVSADTVLLLGMALYIVSLCIACMMPCGALRATAVTSAALTLLYTPLFKPIVGVKTLVCATVMAASPFFGALAALGPSVCGRAIPTSLLIFGCMCFRETVADVADRAGDAAGNICTLPLLIGSAPALIATAVIASVCCAAAAVVATAPLEGLARTALTIGFFAVTAGRVAQVAMQVIHNGCDPASARWGKEQSIAPIAGGLCILALCM